MVSRLPEASASVTAPRMPLAKRASDAHGSNGDGKLRRNGNPTLSLAAFRYDADAARTRIVVAPLSPGPPPPFSASSIVLLPNDDRFAGIVNKLDSGVEVEYSCQADVWFFQYPGVHPWSEPTFVADAGDAIAIMPASSADVATDFNVRCFILILQIFDTNACVRRPSPGENT